MPDNEWPGRNWCPDRADILAILVSAEIRKAELLPTGSNYVFALQLESEHAGPGVGIYKPQRGEAPLWDYPSSGLYKRAHAQDRCRRHGSVIARIACRLR